MQRATRPASRRMCLLCKSHRTRRLVLEAWDRLAAQEPR